MEPVDTDPRGTGFAMVPGDPALGDLKPGAVIDVVVASVSEGLFKGLWHGDLYMVEGLAAGVWTLMGYKLAHVQSGVGYLSKDSDSHEFLRPPLELSSFGMLKELCSGIGCISVGTSFAGCKTSLYVDVSQIACDTVRLNGGTALQGNLSDRAVRIQVLSDNASARCLYSAGFPCNSYSPQGSGGGLADPRGQVLLYVLQTIWHGQAAGVILECVQQVEEHQDTMRLLALFADKMQFQMTTVRLDLAHQWCSRRQRWWAVMVPHNALQFSLLPWPSTSKGPSVEDTIPEWPLWPEAQEHDLMWTDREHSMYSNPDFGSDARRLDVKGQAPTALHSWGAALTEVQAPFEWPHSCDVCLVPLLHQGHWTLLALHPSETGGLQAECWESIPGRNVAVAHALAELLCAFCRAQLVSFSESCHQVQVEAASCGAYLLAHAGQVLFGEGACFDGLLADSRAFLRHIPPHTACRWGTGGLSDAQVSELQKILCDRGVPDTVVGERVRAAVDKIGAGSIAKALQASNVWQALKSAGSAPASLFRWVLPEELKAHAQAKASKSFGTAVPNAKARKQKPSKGPKPVLHVHSLISMR